MLLRVRELEVFYHTAVLLNRVDLNIEDNEFVAMIGPNGAGKTTFLRAIAGLTRWERSMMKGMRSALSDIVTRGEVVFNGERIDTLTADLIARRGLILCPERGRPFVELSVLDNLNAGAYALKNTERKYNLSKVFELFPKLKDRRKQISGTLSGGERVMLSIGRSIMGNPKLLCLDEPSTGLAPNVKEDLFEKLADLKKMNINIMLVEQDVSFAFALSTRNYVMSKGKIIAEGNKEVLLNDDKIRRLYLGL